MSHSNNNAEGTFYTIKGKESLKTTDQFLLEISEKSYAFSCQF